MRECIVLVVAAVFAAARKSEEENKMFQWWDQENEVDLRSSIIISYSSRNYEYKNAIFIYLFIAKCKYVGTKATRPFGFRAGRLEPVTTRNSFGTTAPIIIAALATS